MPLRLPKADGTGRSAIGEIEVTAAGDASCALKKKHGRLNFCHEAGPTGYGLYRQIVELGHRCEG
ncbi:hypothetical protein LJR234_000084 [Mesorhizobium amorphae]|uniref:hypothetical protein n=1 Tax=Mesorhizobium amorphae TaxID=71433 RepID=UPI003ECF33FC